MAKPNRDCSWCGQRRAIFARHYATDSSQQAWFVGICLECSTGPLLNKTLMTARTEPLIHITPHSPEHITLECAFHTLVHGLSTPAELRRMNEAARNKEAA